MINVQFFILVLFDSWIINNLNSTPIGNNALLDLSKYGYIGESMINGSNSISFRSDTSVFQKALESLQSFAGLDVTGKPDRNTIQAMDLPRCGLQDNVENSNHIISNRYILQAGKWEVKDLTYQIHKYPRNLHPECVDAEIQKAFNIWSSYTDLTFTPSKSLVDINISFEYGEHGDGYGFDGANGLAHAFFLTDGVVVHFDAEEQWTINSYEGKNLLQVAAHEFGHLLGLKHSHVETALMAPFFSHDKPELYLDTDDIQAIQALYGKKTHRSGTHRRGLF